MKSLRNRFALISAQLEAYLTTHAFTILFTIFYALAVFLMFVLGFQTEFIRREIREIPAVNFSLVGIWFLSLARGTGYTLNLNTPIVLLLSARLVFTRLRRMSVGNILPLDAAFPDLHIVVGYVILFSVFIHASFHMTWILLENGWESGIFHFTFSVVTGFTLLLIMAVIVFMGQPKIRSKYFRLFRILHVGGAFLFFGVLIFHGSFRQVPETYKWVTIPIVIYVVDRIFRRFKAANAEISLTAENAEILGDILTLRVPKPFMFQAGQYAEIQVPSIGIEWHPFTIASAPHEKLTTFFIKAVGDWTGELKSQMMMRLSGEEDTPLRVKVRGPYGAPAQHVEGYEKVVLISGGVGATPFTAICKDLHRKNVVYNMFHENTDEENTGPLYSALLKFDERIKIAISSLFGIDVIKFDEGDERKGVFAADMLNLTNNLRGQSQDGSNPQIESDLSTPGEDEEGLGKNHEMNEEEFLKRISTVAPEHEELVLKRISTTALREGEKRKRSAGMHDLRAKLLAFLHTARVQFLLLVLLIFRMGVAAVGDIIRKSEPILGETVYNPLDAWVPIADISLGSAFGFILILTIILELSFMGKRYFSSAPRVFDLFGFIPLTLVSIGISAALIIEGTEDLYLAFQVNSGGVLSLLFILMAIRLHRAVRLRSLLTDTTPAMLSEGKEPEVDFVWTTRHENDDEWIRKELAPLTGGTELRLHRYVTRAKEVDVETGANILTSAHAGRPEWDQMFQKIAASTKSRSTIGVFFCGPKPMGKAVQGALRKAEIVSNLKAAYLTRTSGSTLLKDLGVPNVSVLRKLERRGCGIRFVFKEENFS